MPLRGRIGVSGLSMSDTAFVALAPYAAVWGHQHSLALPGYLHPRLLPE